MGWDKIDAQWRKLDPVFVRGMQRSGTSIVARALRTMGIGGFGEGHLWFEVVRPFEKLHDPSFRPHARADSYALGQDRVSHLEKYVTLAVDQFHRDHLSLHHERWLDKSPGVEGAQVAPLLGRIFPRAQFIFVYRNGITCIHSGINQWPDQPDIFAKLCKAWTSTMSTWREARESLTGRYIEIAHEDLVHRPFETASRLTAFLQRPEAFQDVVDLFQSTRAVTSFPDKPPGDYGYQIDWSPEQKAFFVKTCSEEMRAWGYECDFDSPEVTGGAPPSADCPNALSEELAKRDARIAQLERECRVLREHISLVERGRVMRILNRLRAWASRLLRRGV